MPPKDEFDYAAIGPICEEGHAFRLLRLIGGRGDEVHCELFKAYINQPEDIIPYEALSYTWGNSKRSKHIILNGRDISITPNLRLALQNLRGKVLDRILWIDAICINQEDHREKDHQLGYMASIYRQAERVIFWLGSSTYETDLLMSTLNLLQKQAYKKICRDWTMDDERWTDLWSSIVPDSLDHPQYWSGLESMLKRPWFRRVWILQECAHARRGVIACGQKFVAAHIFALAPSLLGIEPEQHCQSVLDIMPGSPRKGWWKEGRDLFTLLLKFQRSEASEAQDKVYALLSMATDVEGKGFPNFNSSLSLQQILKQTFLFLFPLSWKDGIPEYHTYSEFIIDLEMLNNTAIMQAAMEGKDMVLSQLLRRSGVNPNIRGVTGYTPLEEAADRGHTEVVNLLVNFNGILMNTTDRQQRTPFFKALSNHHTAVVQLLIDTPGVDCMIMDSEKITPMTFAVDSQQGAVVKRFLQNPTNNATKTLCCASKETLMTSVKSYEKEKAWDKFLSLAIETDDADLLLLLLKLATFDDLMVPYTDPPNDKLTVEARSAVAWICTALAREDMLKIHTCDKSGNTLLSWVLENWDLDLLQQTLKYFKMQGPDIVPGEGSYTMRTTSILKTIHRGGMKAVTFLRNFNGLDIIAADYRLSSMTPLGLAVESNSKDLVELLLVGGGELSNQRYRRDSILTALERAIEIDRKEMVETILSANGVDVSYAIGMASRRGDENLLNLLLSYQNRNE